MSKLCCQIKTLFITCMCCVCNFDLLQNDNNKPLIISKIFKTKYRFKAEQQGSPNR